jgi:hypothetical protein
MKGVGARRSSVVHFPDDDDDVDDDDDDVSDNNVGDDCDNVVIDGGIGGKRIRNRRASLTEVRRATLCHVILVFFVVLFVVVQRSVTPFRVCVFCPFRFVEALNATLCDAISCCA